MGYRQKYLQGKSRVHMCKYCGAIRTTKSITIDHVLPQNFFKKINSLIIFINIVDFVILFGLNILGEYSEQVRKLALFVNSNINDEVKRWLMLFIPISILVILLLDKFKNSKMNLVSSCRKCNSSKSDKIDFRVVRGFLSLLLFSKFGFISIGVTAIYFLSKHVDIF